MNAHDLAHDKNQDSTLANLPASGSHIRAQEKQKQVDANNNNTNLPVASSKKRKRTKNTNADEILYVSYMNEKYKALTEEEFNALKVEYALRKLEMPTFDKMTRKEYEEEKTKKGLERLKERKAWVISVNDKFEWISDELGKICSQMQDEGKNMEALIPGFQNIEKLKYYTMQYRMKSQKSKGKKQNAAQASELVSVDEELQIIPTSMLAFYRTYYLEKHNREPIVQQMTRDVLKNQRVKQSKSKLNNKLVWIARINNTYHIITDAEGEKYDQMIKQGKSVEDLIPGFQGVEHIKHHAANVRLEYQKKKEEVSNNNNAAHILSHMEQYAMTPARSANLGVFVSKPTLTANTTDGEQQEITKENSGSRLEH